MISRRKFVGRAAMGGVVLAVPNLIGCRKSGDILIGSILGLSGEDSSLGVETKEGMTIALDDINAAGGFKGRKLRVLYEDTQLKPDLANEKIQKLIDRER